MNEEYKGYTFEGWVQPCMHGAMDDETFFYTQVVLSDGSIALKRAYRARVSRLLLAQNMQQNRSLAASAFRLPGLAEAFTQRVLPRLRALVDEGGIPEKSWPIEAEPVIEPLL